MACRACDDRAYHSERASRGRARHLHRSHYAGDLADVRLFHYLRVAAIDKNRDFASVASVGAMLARADLDPVNREMARHLGPVHAAVLADGA